MFFTFRRFERRYEKKRYLDIRKSSLLIEKIDKMTDNGITFLLMEVTKSYVEDVPGFSHIFAE